MPSADDPGADLTGLGKVSHDAAEQVHSQLVEALMLLLIEKGVLTKNDALSVVQTVAQVQQGQIVEDREPPAGTQAALQMLQRMYVSFEAIAEGSNIRAAGSDNVHQLRPPVYGDDRPEFPGDD